MAGLEPTGRAQALEAVFNAPAGNFLGLLEVLPVDGSGEVEIAPPGYGRQLVSAWTTTEIDGVTSRCNALTAGFGPYPVDVTTRGWAIWDAPVGGNLIASGLFFDTGGGMAGEVFVTAGDDVQFQPGDLCVSLAQDCPVEVGVAGSCPAVVEVRIYDNTVPASPVLLNTKGPGTPAYTLGVLDTRPILVEIDLDMAINPPDWSQTYDDGDLPNPPRTASYSVQTWTLEYVSPGGDTTVVTRDMEDTGNCYWSERLTRSITPP